MNLSAEQISYLSKLKREQASLRKLRWAFLLLTVLLLAVSFGSVLYFYVTDNLEMAKYVVGHPVFYITGIGSGFTQAYARKGFKGDPEKELFIKLIETLSNENS